MSSNTHQNNQALKPESNDLLIGFLNHLQQNGMMVGRWSKIGDYLNPVSKDDREKMIQEYVDVISKNQS